MSDSIKAIMAVLAAEGANDDISKAVMVGLENAENAAVVIAKGGGLDTLADNKLKVAAIGVAIAVLRWKLTASVEQIGAAHPPFAELVEAIEKVTADNFGPGFAAFVEEQRREIFGEE